MKYALALLLVGCGGPATVDRQAAPPEAPPTAAAPPPAPASEAPAAAAPSAPPEPAPAAVVSGPPGFQCSVFVYGPEQTTTRLAVVDKQFQRAETTRSELQLHTKVLKGDAAKRTALCDAFARRSCPVAFQGDATRCRYAITEGDTAEWDTATPVPAPPR